MDLTPATYRKAVDTVTEVLTGTTDRNTVTDVRPHLDILAQAQAVIDAYFETDQ
jgi:mitochondrial fission protein ELM1